MGGVGAAGWFGRVWVGAGEADERRLVVTRRVDGFGDFGPWGCRILGDEPWAVCLDTSGRQS